jgi:hypothetical protein
MGIFFGLFLFVQGGPSDAFSRAFLWLLSASGFIATPYLYYEQRQDRRKQVPPTAVLDRANNIVRLNVQRLKDKDGVGESYRYAASIFTFANEAFARAFVKTNAVDAEIYPLEYLPGHDFVSGRCVRCGCSQDAAERLHWDCDAKYVDVI